MCVCACARSCLTLCNRTEFSRREYWCGLPLFPTPGDLPGPEIEPMSLSSPVFSWNSFAQNKFPGSSTKLLTKTYSSLERKKREKLWACLCAQSCPTLCDPVDCSLPGSSCLWDSPSTNTGLVCHLRLSHHWKAEASETTAPWPWRVPWTRNQPSPRRGWTSLSKGSSVLTPRGLHTPAGSKEACVADLGLFL